MNSLRLPFISTSIFEGCGSVTFATGRATSGTLRHAVCTARWNTRRAGLRRFQRFAPVEPAKMPLGRSLFAALAESVCGGDGRAHDSLSMLVQSGWDIDAPGPEGRSRPAWRRPAGGWQAAVVPALGTLPTLPSSHWPQPCPTPFCCQTTRQREHGSPWAQQTPRSSRPCWSSGAHTPA